MEIINKLLDKYFAGTSTLEEEKLLKAYFSSDDVASEHLMYQPLFTAFARDAEIKHPEKPANLQFRLTIRKMIYAGSSVAATVLIAFWLTGSPFMKNDYAIINGNKINDSELAQEMAMNKLNRINNILDNSLQPLESITGFKDKLEPLEKISVVEKELESIRLLLNSNE